jgi:hypothetical protein
MDDIVQLGEPSQRPVIDVDFEYGFEYVDEEVLVSCPPASTRDASHARVR